MGVFRALFSAVLLVGVMALALVPSAWAFHDDGVARCEACHVMHSTDEGGQPVVGEGGQYLLLKPNPTDLCLMCHGQGTTKHNVMSKDVLSPEKRGRGAGGGDFVFLLEDNLNDGPEGDFNIIPGERAGHNIIGTGLSSDNNFVASPGGSYPSNNLTCISCHDPHGGKQYRFLYGSDTGKSTTSRSLGYSFTFTVPAPVTQEMPVFATETRNIHNAYKSGMTEWCKACHKDVHKHNSAFEHPQDEDLGRKESDNYNSYNGTLDPDNKSLIDPYLAMVPLEWDSTSNSTSYIGPVDQKARVMCLSCHRAHASSGPYSGRWDFNIANWSEEGVASGSYALENPYAATSGDQQQRLCEKCHGLGEPGD